MNQTHTHTHSILVFHTYRESNGKDDSSNLPEGFFDNPLVDAKVRYVAHDCWLFLV